MFASRVFSRVSRNTLNQCLHRSSSRPNSASSFSNGFHSVLESSHKVPPLSHSLPNSTGSRGFWFSSSASHQAEKEPNQPADGQEVSGGKSTSTKVEGTGDTVGDGKGSKKMEDASSGSEPKPSPSESVKRRKRGTKRTAFSDSDTESDLSRNDLVKLVFEKENAMKAKQEEVEKLKDQVLRTYADMENLMDRTKREAENSKKFAVQNFAKSLLDVADNLGRASTVVKDSFSKIDPSKDTIGAVPLLKTLLEGVEMTDKQLIEVFKKFGVEKYDPIGEQFDPNRHQAVFQIPDASKPAGTIAAVLKSGYMLHERIIRPADVGVIEAPNDKTDQTSNNETHGQTPSNEADQTSNSETEKSTAA